jgi:hypothetical protein
MEAALGPLTSIAAGFAAALGAVALFRALQRRARLSRKDVDGSASRDGAAAGEIIDLEFDETSGAYRAK